MHEAERVADLLRANPAEDAERIRAMVARGVTRKQVAREYGMSVSGVGHVVRGYTHGAKAGE